MNTAPTGLHTREVVPHHEVLKEIKRLAYASWVDHLVVRDERGQTVVYVPLAVGLAAFVLAPTWAALGGIASMRARCTIDIELRDRLAPPEGWPLEAAPDVDKALAEKER